MGHTGALSRTLRQASSPFRLEQDGSGVSAYALSSYAHFTKKWFTMCRSFKGMGRSSRIQFASSYLKEGSVPAVNRAQENASVDILYVTVG